MNTRKRVGLVALLMASGAIFAATPLWAGKPLPKVEHYTYTLVPPADSPKPNASGNCTFETYATLPRSVAVSCRGLIPSQQYWVVHVTSSPDGSVEEAAYPFTTDARGRFDGEYRYGGYTSGLWIENAAGEAVLVLGQLRN